MAAYFVNKSGNNTTGSSWANAYTTMAACIARPPAAGDTIWVGDDHTESQATTYSWTFPGAVLTAPYFIACVDHTVASPGFADLRQGTATGGAFISTGNTTLILGGNFYMYGLYFMLGTGAVGASTQLNGGLLCLQTYEKCYIGFGNTAASIAIILNNAGSFSRYIDCTFKYAAVTQYMSGRNTKLLRCNIDTGAGVSPTSQLIGLSSGRFFIEDCDFSNCPSIAALAGNPGGQVGYVQFKRCRLPNVPYVTATSSTSTESFIIDTVQCGTGALGLSQNDRSMIMGLLKTDLNAARDTGAVDSGKPVSWKITTISTTVWHNYFYSNPIVVWNDNVTTPVSITVEGIADPRDFVALPKNDEVWIEANYHGNASASIVGRTVSGTKANPWDTAAVVTHTASTADWTAGTAVARANSTGYALNTILKVPSKPGMLFIVTAAGATAASDAAYASVVDGQTGIVEAGAMRVAAFWRFKQTITMPAAATYAGYIYVTAKVGKGSVLNGCYIDPKAVLA